MLQISDGEPHEGGHDTTSIEQSPELSGVELGGNTMGEEKSDLLPPDPERTQPTLDHFVKDVLPQVEGEQLGEANELVEDTETRGKSH